MKKLSILFATLIAVLGLSSCSQDRDPVYQNPTSFVLNEPVFANNYYQTQEGNTFYLFCSQPDYGYAAIANYSVQVSLTGKFDKSIDEVAAGERYDYVTITPTGKGTSCQMNFKDEDLALAMCQLVVFNVTDRVVDEDTGETFSGEVQGLKSESELAEAFPAPVKVYFRAVSELDNVEGSRIVSNVVALDKVMPHFAVPMPAFIYLIGDCGGWKEPAEGNADALKDWKLKEKDDEIGSKVFYGTFDIPAGKATFRFYTALTGWDGGDSLGYQEADETTTFPDYTEGEFSSAIIKGKGNFGFPNWVGGKMEIMVDMSSDQMVLVINGIAVN